MKHTMDELKAWQRLPLDEKLRLTQMRIAQWYRFYDGDVYVSYSGGKDSTVLLDICRTMYDVIEAVHVNTGLEYPEVEKFVADTDNVTIIKPKLTLREVICKYGYLLISKEVSECVYGARKYLTSLINDGIVPQTDRQTDRQTIPIRIRSNCWNGSISKASDRANTICTNTKRTDCLELADKKSREQLSRGGGYDNKYRKLRGIGEYSKQSNVGKIGWSKSETCNNVRNADERQGTSDKGEYP